MLSNIEITYLSYRVVPLFNNGVTPIIENKHLKIESVSEISSNLGYNSDKSKYHKNSTNGKDFVFRKMLDKEIKKIEDSEPVQGTDFRKR